jgi:3-oxoacyl-[acyl-carrier-protein] synthase II
MRRRVAITGVGLVSAFGCAVDSFWQALAGGRSAVIRIDGGPEPQPLRVGAPVTGFSIGGFVDPKSQRVMTPPVAFGVAAAELAATDSGLRFEAIEPTRIGVFVGSRGHSSDRRDLQPAVDRASTGGEFRLDAFGAEGLPLVHPMWLLKGLSNLVLYFVSLRFNAQGPNNNLTAGGLGGTLAIGEAFRAIQQGSLDVAIAGGYDSVLDVDRLELFAPSGLVTTSTDPSTASRPFDRRRDGFVRGEGAGFLILERLESAVERGARIRAELLGYGCATANPLSSVLGPSSRGFAGALCSALADAGGVFPDAVFAFGLATASSDAEETRGLKHALGARSASIPCPAVKSMIGNTFAASGPLEAAAAIMALADGLLPPTINLTEPDHCCDLDYVAATAARPAPLCTVALNNASLAGAHAALVLGKFQ